MFVTKTVFIHTPLSTICFKNIICRFAVTIFVTHHFLKFITGTTRLVTTKFILKLMFLLKNHTTYLINRSR